MANVPPTISEIIDIANISQYLASRDVAFDGIFNWGSLDKDLPLKIYDVREAVEWANNEDYSAQSATAIFFIGGSIHEGDTIEVFVEDPIEGLISIGFYELTQSDTTYSIIATNLAAAINLYGYSAVSINDAVVVTAPLSAGSLLNGISLTIEFTPFVATEFEASINGVDLMLINETDVLIF
jgi:hypothetical protein